MFAGLRPRRPRHATVVAYLALFVALGGTAYAANEWTGANIVDESLTGADIQGKAGTAVTPAVNGSITSDDVAGQEKNLANGTPFVDGTLTTWDVKDHSLKRADLAGGLIGNTELAADAVTGAKVADDTLTSADIATDGVAAAEIQDNSIDTGEIVDNSLFADDLGTDAVGSSELQTGAVGSSELAANAVDSGKVANNALALADIKGADASGTVNFAAGAVPVGGCGDVSVTVIGSKVNEAVVVSLKGPVAGGMLFYGVRVQADDHATMTVCNFTGGSSPAITNLPVRVVTFG